MPRATSRSRRRCSASTATRCARRCSSCGSRGSVDLVSNARRALISVSDKSGVVDFARALAARGFSLLSTGGTAALLEREGIPVTEVSAYTGFPEMLDGRVKTLHPRIHAGLLARGDDAKHRAALAAAGIDAIELLVVNLYPFQATVARAGDELWQRGGARRSGRLWTCAGRNPRAGLGLAGNALRARAQGVRAYRG